MDNFFKNVKNNPLVRKSFELEEDLNEVGKLAEDIDDEHDDIIAGKTKEDSPEKKDTQSDNLKFVGSIIHTSKPLVIEPLKEDAIPKPTTTDEVKEECKFDYFAETPPPDEDVPKPKEAEVFPEPNDFERMLEEAGEKNDFLN